jgi:hypothetical protein
MSNADDLISITRKRWQWDDTVLSIRRYAQFLRGELDESSDGDVEWANDIDCTADDIAALVRAAANGSAE